MPYLTEFLVVYLLTLRKSQVLCSRGCPKLWSHPVHMKHPNPMGYSHESPETVFLFLSARGLSAYNVCLIWRFAHPAEARESFNPPQTVRVKLLPG